MTQDQQGRWRLGAREWIAFAVLVVALLTHGVVFVTWMAKIEAEVATQGAILRRLDDRREEGAALVQRVNDHDRRIGNLEARTVQ